MAECEIVDNAVGGREEPGKIFEKNIVKRHNRPALQDRRREILEVRGVGADVPDYAGKLREYATRVCGGLQRDEVSVGSVAEDGAQPRGVAGCEEKFSFRSECGQSGIDAFYIGVYAFCALIVEIMCVNQYPHLFLSSLNNSLGRDVTMLEQRRSCLRGSCAMRNRNSMWARTIHSGARRSARPL